SVRRSTLSGVRCCTAIGSSFAEGRSRAERPLNTVPFPCNGGRWKCPPAFAGGHAGALPGPAKRGDMAVPALRPEGELRGGDLHRLPAALRRLDEPTGLMALARRAAVETRVLARVDLAAVALLDGPDLLCVFGTAGAHTRALPGLRIPAAAGLGWRVLLE